MADEQSDPGEDTHWDLKYRSEEEMEFFTEMALHETQRWIEAVTRQKFLYPDDPRKSLENGVQLCELLNCLKAGSVKKINRFLTPLAGLDNVNVFLEACRTSFGLTNTQLFDSCELQDLSQRAIADKTTHLKEENDRRLRNVAVTIFFLGKSAIASDFNGPRIDPNAFAGLFEHQHVDLIPEKTSAYSSSWESKRLQSNKYFSRSDQFSGSSGIGSRFTDDDQHIGDSSYESIGSKGSDDNQSICSDGMPSTTSGMHHFGGSLNSLQQAKSFDSDIYQSTPSLYDDIRKSPASTDSADAMSNSSHSRQSSGSVEGSSQRKPLQKGTAVVATDPLQFIKPKSNPLLETAQKQISLTEKNKVVRTSISLDTEEDWHQNLNSWKSKRQIRKSVSTNDEPEDTQVTKRASKTFKEIVEEREKRKSLRTIIQTDDDSENSLPLSDSLQSENVSRNSDSTKLLPTSVHSKPDDTVIKKQEGSNRKDNSSINSNSNANSNKNNNNSNYDNSDDDVFVVKRKREEAVLKPTEAKAVESARDLRTKNDVEANNLKNIKQTAGVEETQPPLPSLVSPILLPPASPPSQAPPDHQENEQQLQPPQNQISHIFKSDELRSETSLNATPASVERVASPRPEKDFVERSIKISQSLKSEKGFGFLLQGGVDNNSPIVVHRIELGSAADICELRPRDVIVSINKEDIQQQTLQKVQQIIDKSIQQGQIELRVRRYLRGVVMCNEEEQNNINDKNVVAAKYHLTSNRSHSTPVTKPGLIRESKTNVNNTEPTKIGIYKTQFSPENIEEAHVEIKTSPSKYSPNRSMQVEADIYNDNMNSTREPKPTVTQTPPLINLKIPQMETSNFTNVTHQPHQTSASLDSTPAFSSLPLSSSSSTTSIQPPALLRRWQKSRGTERSSCSDMPLSPKNDDTFGTETTLNSTFPPRHSLSLEKVPVTDTMKKSDSCDHLLFQVRDIRSYAQENNNNRTPTFLPILDNKVQRQTSPTKDQPVTEQAIEKVEKTTNNFSSPLNIQIPSQTSVSTSLLQIDPKNQAPQATTYNNEGGNSLPEYTFNVGLMHGEKVADKSTDGEGKLNPLGHLMNNNSSQLLTTVPKHEEEEDDDDDEDEEVAKERRRLEEEERILAEQRMIAQERRLIEEEKGKRLEVKRLREEAEEKKRLQQKKLMLQQEKVKLEKEKQRIVMEKQKMDEERRALLEQQQRLEEEKKIHQAAVATTIEKTSHQPSFSAQPQHPDSSPRSMISSSKYAPQQSRASPDTSPKSGPIQISPLKKLMSNKIESAISRFSKSENEPRESQRLTREDLLAMNRKATPLQEKPESNSNISHHVAPVKREPPSKNELHSLNAVPKARHRDPKEWIVPDSSEAARMPVGRLLSRKSELSSSSSSFSSSTSPFTSSASKEYYRASQPRSTFPADNVLKYTDGGRRQEGLPKESQLASQPHWMVEKSERRLSDHWTEGKEEPWRRGPSESRTIRPVSEISNNPRRDLTSSRGGIKPYVYNQTSMFTPLENTPALRPASNHHSYSSYGDSSKSLGHDVPSSNLYGLYNKNNNSLQPFQGQGGIVVPQPRDSSTATKLPTTPSSDKTEQVPVTGIEKCSHCNEKLMNTAAMAIETLGLYYHVKCFRCSVCHIQLGNGTEGTDVRIRLDKLHCQNCYSYNEGITQPRH